MDDLHIALWQTPYAASSTEALQRLETACGQARAQGADLIVTPEMFLTGYAIGAEDIAARAEAADGALAQAVGAIAQRLGIGIVYGYPEHTPGGKTFNAVQAIDPDGARLMNYRKTHLYGELDRAQFSPGDAAPAVFDWQGWRLGMLICYDVEFPEAVRLLALQGADAVLVPTANMAGFEEVPRLLVPARACENRLFVAYANACGREDDLAYGGASTLAGPDGKVLVTAERDQTLLCAKLSRQALVEAATGAQGAARRVDLYGALLKAPAGPPG